MNEHWGGVLLWMGFLIDFFSNGEDILFRVVVDFEFFFLEINIGRVSKISRINYVKFRRGFFDVYIYIYMEFSLMKMSGWEI